MREILFNYQRGCTAVGAQRVRLLEMALATAIAQAVQVPNGEPLDGDRTFTALVMTNAMDVVSIVNEHTIIATDRVMANVRAMWVGRYLAVNDIGYPEQLVSYYKNIQTGDPVVAAGHDYWAKEFLQAVKSEFKKSIIS